MSKTTYLFVSDFDRTLSLDDGGVLLSELIGISREEFEKKVNSIANKYFVQQGAELSYLIEYDPDYKGKIKREDFIKIGKKITLKNHIKELVSILEEGIGNAKFKFYINSAAPREMIVSALGGMVNEKYIYGTEFNFDERGIVQGIKNVNAGYGKVRTIDILHEKEKIPYDRILYVGDGVSDVNVMLHLRTLDGYPIAASKSDYLGHIAKRSVISDDALAFLIPIMEDILDFSIQEIRKFFLERNIIIQDWKRAKVDWITIV
ncbi:HAD-IB family phosphatase [Candidatus Aminicenantes bacterium AC-335-A11]|jgi:HAD superfamily phosphoserine phosphatase-like hydrolase|nr:HAD-IB family phosphatase [SCandidatus Aminicenantes bacterium Aminicenantia_JdfR_composite]MCP2596327.1 HAD-IB family phosphatase [Candidatus Aminicenantes bacterium AC-335-G13]MCP2617802.1 HAD-IB family phosphatase [Candidatus Aminicenantes bacterium AC-335-A11]